jgi:hypothetical protein
LPAPLQLIVATVPPRMVTIFMRGTLSHAGAARATGTLALLPLKVRNAHLDLARVRMFDVAALELMLDFVREWARERDGCVSVTPPINGLGAV